MNEKVLARLHECQVDMLDVIDAFCRRHGLSYYLIGGTLLGAVRHQGFIPWDDDIDIAMPRADYDFLLNNLQADLSEDYFLQTCFTDNGYGRDFAKLRKNNTVFLEQVDAHVDNRHHGIFLDIFPLDSRPEKRSFFGKIKYRLYQAVDSYVVCKRGRVPTSKKSKLFVLLPMKAWLSIRDKLKKGRGDYRTMDAVPPLPASFYEPAVKLLFEGKEYAAPNQYDALLRAQYGDYMQLPPENERVTHNPLRISFDLGGEDETL